MLHQEVPGGASASLPDGRYGLPVRPLGIPESLNAWLQPFVLVAYLAALGRSATGLLGRAAPSQLLAPACLALTQALWFVVPSVVRQFDLATPFEVLDWAHHEHYFVWIAAGHAIQYLWVTAFTARHTPGHQGFFAFYGKALASSAGVWMLPAIALGPAALGWRSLDAGLALLVAAAVNVHHFILDGAIWKLRGRVAAVLIRNADDEADAAPRRPLVRNAVWATCALALGAGLWQVAQEELSRRALVRGDLAAAERAEARLAWIGHDRAQARRILGRERLAEGDVAAARAQLERSLALEPSLAGHALLARALARAGDARSAATQWEHAVALAPNHAKVRRNAAASLLAAGDAQAAVAHLEAARRLRPRDGAIARELAQARAALRRTL